MILSLSNHKRWGIFIFMIKTWYLLWTGNERAISVCAFKIARCIVFSIWINTSGNFLTTITHTDKTDKAANNDVRDETCFLHLPWGQTQDQRSTVEYTQPTSYWLYCSINFVQSYTFHGQMLKTSITSRTRGWYTGDLGKLQML